MGPRRDLTSGVVLAICLTWAAAASAQYQGWLIPEDGRGEKSPVASSVDAARRGQALFTTHCASCHGAGGKGDGAASDHAADLTDEYRAALNPDGVLFYKVWNGHAVQLRVQIDDMPAFRETLTRAQVWDLVEYLKRLRTPSR